jgi:4-alpha-glucanotransferase
VAGAAAGSYGVRQLPLSVAVVLRRQRAPGQPGRPNRGRTAARKRLRRQLVPAATINYETVIPFKQRLLKTAWTTFRAGARGDLRSAYEQFCTVHRHWLEEYALFRALKAEHSDAYYLTWSPELVRRTPAALAQARRNLWDQIDQIRFAQFLLFRQGEHLKAHARAKGLRLIGDLPFFVSADSSDVWANPELFLLDEQHRPRFVAGVPPDYFSVRGSSGATPSMTGTLFVGPAIGGA